jgi:hypothetical protein
LLDFSILFYLQMFFCELLGRVLALLNPTALVSGSHSECVFNGENHDATKNQELCNHRIRAGIISCRGELREAGVEHETVTTGTDATGAGCQPGWKC